MIPNLEVITLIECTKMTMGWTLAMMGAMRTCPGIFISGKHPGSRMEHKYPRPRLPGFILFGLQQDVSVLPSAGSDPSLPSAHAWWLFGGCRFALASPPPAIPPSLLQAFHRPSALHLLHCLQYPSFYSLLSSDVGRWDVGGTSFTINSS